MIYRLREADVILEFDKIKREIATIKIELEEEILVSVIKFNITIWLYSIKNR